MSLLVPENHGLKPGSPIVFRGTATGDVRSVKLAEDGSHVVVQLRIAHSYRSTVTDESRFWIARPYVSGAFFTGFTVTDVAALLSPFVSYYTEPGQGVPVEDGFRIAATATRPDVRVAEVPTRALQPRRAVTRTTDEPVVLVRVVYAAVEEDTFSANDPVRHEGSGVLYLDGSGRAAVFTARSIADGSYTEADSFGGDPDIGQEQIKVLIPNGPVLRAHRVWVAPDGRDLAVLVLEGAPPNLGVTASEMFDFGEVADEAITVVRAAREDGVPQAPEPVKWPTEVPTIERYRGGALMAGGRVAGVFGWTAPRTDAPALVRIGVVPEDLRPRP